MCMYTEQEFRNVRLEIREVQLDVERDRREWRAAIHTLRRANEQVERDRCELRAAIDQLRRAIDRIRQRDGRAAGQALMSALPRSSSRSRSPSPEFREVTVTAAEQDLYTQLMYVQVAVREDRHEWRASIQQLRRATALLRQQMPVTATATTTTTTTTTTSAGASTTPPPPG